MHTVIADIYSTSTQRNGNKYSVCEYVWQKTLLSLLFILLLQIVFVATNWMPFFLGLHFALCVLCRLKSRKDRDPLQKGMGIERHIENRLHCLHLAYCACEGREEMRKCTMKTANERRKIAWRNYR